MFSIIAFQKTFSWTFLKMFLFIAFHQIFHKQFANVSWIFHKMFLEYFIKCFMNISQNVSWIFHKMFLWTFHRCINATFTKKFHKTFFLGEIYGIIVFLFRHLTSKFYASSIYCRCFSLIMYLCIREPYDIINKGSNEGFPLKWNTEKMCKDIKEISRI